LREMCVEHERCALRTETIAQGTLEMSGRVLGTLLRISSIAGIWSEYTADNVLRMDESGYF